MNIQSATGFQPDVSKEIVERIVKHYDDGNLEEARVASDELLGLMPLDYAALHLAGVIATAQNRLPEASGFLKNALSMAPDIRNAAASWCALGQALFAARDFRQAEEAFRRAHNMDPKISGYAIELAQTYAAQWKLDRAIDVLQHAIKRFPTDASLCVALGSILTQAGRQADAIILFELAIQREPTNVSAHHNLSNTLKMLGQYREAEIELRKALQLNPNSELFSQLVQLKKFAADAPEIDTIKDRLISPINIPIGARIDAGFALARVYDDLSDYRTAFQYLAEANQLKRTTITYSAEAEEVMVNGIMALYTRDFLLRFAGMSTSKLAPIFIVGMPRSGTTLIEQILASHSQIQDGGELPYIVKLTSDLGDIWGNRGDYAPGDDATVTQDLARTAERYAELTAHLWHRRPRFTDKLPMNFLAIGPIHLLFPKATIIYCRRDPMATCFSCYQNLFTNKNVLYSYNLTELGHFYRLHELMMQHWRTILPDRILEIDYESFIDALEEGVRRLLAFCNLRFESETLNFHTLNRPIATASSMQVRRPIYKTSISHWENYERFLGPLFDALRADAAHCVKT